MKTHYIVRVGGKETDLAFTPSKTLGADPVIGSREPPMRFSSTAEAHRTIANWLESYERFYSESPAFVIVQVKTVPVTRGELIDALEDLKDTVAPLLDGEWLDPDDIEKEVGRVIDLINRYDDEEDKTDG